MNIEDRIKNIEEEIKSTPYNKATSHHIGKLKAKLSKLKEESRNRGRSSRVGRGFHIKKSGDASVVLVGFPSVGKSTILNELTNASSKIGEYEFTTLEIIPGIMEYKGAKIQIFDIPGIITGASKGRGRGREVLSAVRNADLIVAVLDVLNSHQLNVMKTELRNIGIRPGESPPDITIKPRKLGGIRLSSTIPLTYLNERIIRSILNEYGIHSADILLRDDVTMDQLIDSLDSSCSYIPLISVINKIDLVDNKCLQKLEREMPFNIFISADKQINMDILREEIFKKLKLIRIYLKPQGKKADYDEPLIIKEGSTVKDVAGRLHRDFIRYFRHARIWGGSVKFDSQKVGLDHVLKDEDILRIIISK